LHRPAYHTAIDDETELLVLVCIIPGNDWSLTCHSRGFPDSRLAQAVRLL